MIKEYWCLIVSVTFLHLSGADSPQWSDSVHPLEINSDSSITSSYYSSSDSEDDNNRVKYLLLPDDLLELSIDFETDEEGVVIYRKSKNKLKSDHVGWFGYKIFNCQKLFLKKSMADKPDATCSVVDLSKHFSDYHDLINHQQTQIRTLYSLVRKSFQATKHLEVHVDQLKNELAKRDQR